MKGTASRSFSLKLLTTVFLLAHLSGVITGCSSAPKPAPQAQGEFLQLAQDQCKAENPQACYLLGLEARDQKDNAKAYALFDQACKAHHPASCSEQGIVAHLLGHPEEAIKLTQQSCDLNDTLGCYNLACYYSLSNADENKIYDALDRSSSLGLNELDLIAHDPDLDRVRNSSRFNAWVERFKKRPGHFNHTGGYHWYNDAVGFSFIPLGNFKLSMGPGQVLMEDESNTLVHFSFTSNSFQNSVKLLKSTLQQYPHYTLKSAVDDTVNGYSVHFQVGTTLNQGEETVLLHYFMGNEKATLQGSAQVLSTFADTLTPLLTTVLTNVVINPLRLPDEAHSPFEADSLALIKAKGYEFAGTESGSYHYQRLGQPAEKPNETAPRLPALTLSPLQLGEGEETPADYLKNTFEFNFGISIDPKKIKKVILKEGIRYSYTHTGQLPGSTTPINLTVSCWMLKDALLKDSLGIALLEFTPAHEIGHSPEWVQRLHLKPDFVSIFRKQVESHSKHQKSHEEIKEINGTGMIPEA